MILKKVNAWLHLWLGLASGIIVFVVAITGCILVFEQEIKSMTQPWLHVTRPAGSPYLPPSVIHSKMADRFPGKKIYSVWYYGHERSAQVSMNADSVVYVNPYTADVVAITEDEDFFHFILEGHTELWIEGKVGQNIVLAATLIFFILLITGIILWWPKKWNKSNRDKSFKVKWKAKFKRVNYDLHNVLGFYSLILAAIMSMTGLIMGYAWFSKSIYWLSSGGDSIPAYQRSFTDTTKIHKLTGLKNVDLAWKKGIEEIGVYNKDAIIISFPEKPSDPIDLCTDMHRGSWRYVYLDQHTLKELPSTQVHTDDLRFADWLKRTNYALHVGAIGDIPTKILYFLASLICASLPITGFYVWWGKRKKGKLPKLKRLVLAPIILLMISVNGFAQKAPFPIKGTVSDSVSGKAIEFATISLMDSSKKVVALTYSDENGVFKAAELGAGSFFLNLSFVGYRQKLIPFKIASATQSFDFGSILLHPEVNQLNAVTITGMRQLVEQQPGMLIYNAEKDISNQGGTAADVLRKAPILNVDASGKVTMRGSSNLRILINGKYSGQMARSPGDALNMMPAGSIKSVEVITSPSARYDAEGAAGVINIITKKGNQSTSGTVEVVGGNLEQAINPRISLNRDKWNINSTMHFHRFRNREELNLNRTTFENGAESGRILQKIVRDNAKPHSSGDVQIEFAPDSANLFNFSLNGWLGNWPQNSDQYNERFSPAGDLLEKYHQTVTTKAPNKGLDFNLGYTRKFKIPGEELYLMAQHNRSLDDYNYNALQRDGEQITVYRERNNNRTSNREWTFQTDYIRPFSYSSKHALESGVKLILRNVSSVYDFAASNDETPEILVPIASRTDRFDYRQDVAAAYSQVKFKWNNGWALHTGARMEGTFLEGDQRNAAVNFKNNFWNFAPSATIFKKLDNNNNVTLSYTKRISRPSIWDLNPNRDSQDPKNIVVGSPNLRPEEVNQAELTYALQTDSDFFFNTSLFAKNTDNSIESIITIDNEGIATTTRQNLASNQQYGVNFSTSVGITENWKVNSNSNVRYARFKSGALNIRNDGMSWGINVNSSLKLRNHYSVQFYTDYDARSVTLQGYQTSWLYYSFSAKKEFPARKLSLTLTTVSPFGSYTSQNEVIRSADFTSTFTNRYLMRSVRFSLNWEFGKMQGSGKSRKISNEDLKNTKQGG
jgi:uncharacterized iron-regulated membrane protein/outer membrane receptor protein involved in Fe transport